MEINKVQLALKNKMELAKSKLALNIEEVALLSGLHISTIRKFCKDGKLKFTQHVSPNGKLMFDCKYIEKWIEGSL